ncbi:phospholipase D-like domain-containing protein [Jannaschia rubra]|uniref:Phospholipase D n=1 Tax=Jannaschia rubra TaxID=282197 RepID=A0A0M6XWW5_9RHOB|nr:phospholipase D-like domain-containing protein [Jannaschia rubra]CTQ34771.1 cardiolipin synthetase [Jannaschia rubra]SFG70135.1 phospholipase D1/2 [Jannaschia rubra]
MAPHDVRPDPRPDDGIEEAEILLTASEAFPAFERMFLGARERIVLGFRIFDPRTRLHSPEARAVGEDWFDLVAHTLRRGVALTMVLSDFDAVVRPDYHQRATRCLRLLIAAGEVSGRMDLLSVHTSLHPARTGLLPSVILWPRARGLLLGTVSTINKLPQIARGRRLRELPALMPLFAVKDDRTVSLRQMAMPRLVPVTHHQKIAVADGEVLYVGGLDLNDRRWDTPDHDRPGSETWHDAQLLVRGPVALSAEAHLRSFEAVTHGAEPPPAPGLLRTVSRKRTRGAVFLSPMPVLTEIAAMHEAQADAAERLIYLESQFFRDTKFARHLARAARRNPRLGMVLILPAAPEDVAFDDNSGSDARYGEYLQARAVRIVRRAFGDRLFIGSPAQPRSVPENGRATLYGAPLVYLHAKVSIFDGARAIVSSANLNGRSFRWDTEAGVMLTDPEKAGRLAFRCAAHWLAGPVEPAFTDPASAVQAWRTRARANAARRPEDREGFILPYTSAPARRFGHSIPGIPEEMV